MPRDERSPFSRDTDRTSSLELASLGVATRPPARTVAASSPEATLIPIGSLLSNPCVRWGIGGLADRLERLMITRRATCGFSVMAGFVRLSVEVDVDPQGKRQVTGGRQQVPLPEG